MTRRRLARGSWFGAAAILVAAALVSLVAILGGGFSDVRERGEQHERGGERLVLRRTG